MSIVNYIRTGPFTNGTSPGIAAAFLNALENILEQPSGGFESGRYFIACTPSVTGALCAVFVQTLSRTSTPLSVSSLDTVDSDSGATPGNPATNRLTEGGLILYVLSSGSGTGNNVNVGGNWTIAY